MVLEQFIKEEWLEKRPYYAFFLGLVYAIIAIISAKLIFPASTSLMTIAFVSIMLIPSLNNVLRDEENVEIREKKLGIKTLFKDHYDIFEIYFFMFMGIFCAFALTALVLPEATVLRMFSSQLKVAGITGQAIFDARVMGIMMNNLLVMIVCFILSLAYGAGSILFLAWNASVWGAVFGFVARDSAAQIHPLLSFGCIILPVLPHMITEALSYFSAAIVGGVVSKAVMREELFSEKFHHILTDALLILAFGFVLVVIAAIIEVKLFPSLSFC